MTHPRVSELTKAKDVLAHLGLKSTSAIVKTMENTAKQRKKIEWSEM